MPWRNGRGTTTELAIMPHSPNREDSPFLWRISIAGVEEDGPFSHFPNIERHLMLLRGNGITLDGGEKGVGVLFKPMQVYSFAGDIDIVGTLSNGPIEDLNLMIDRRFIDADLSGFYVDNAQRLMLNSDISFIHLLAGSGAVTLDVDGELMQLKGGDSIQFEKMNTCAAVVPNGSSENRPAIIKASISYRF